MWARDSILKPGPRWVALALVALTLVACGSSGDAGDDSSNPSSSASDQLSKEELITRADKICVDTAEQIRSQSTPTSLADVRQTFAETARKTGAGVDKLKELKPPDSIKADYEAFLERADRAARQADDAADAAKTGDISEVLAAMGNLERDSESRRLARKIGLKECRKGSGSLLPPGSGAPGVPAAPVSP